MPHDVSMPIASAGYQSSAVPQDALQRALRHGLSQAGGSSGRLSLSEYGTFMLAMLMVWSALFCALFGATDDLAVSAVLGLTVVALPVVTASIRRLRDAGGHTSRGDEP